MGPDTTGIGEVATSAAATSATDQISIAYRRDADRAIGVSRNPGDTVTPKNRSRRVSCGAR
jgi:hypothetical protein